MLASQEVNTIVRETCDALQSCPGERKRERETADVLGKDPPYEPGECEWKRSTIERERERLNHKV